MATNTWHKEHKGWKDINGFLFKNKTMADCAFLVTVENTVVKIPAHKYVLGGYSAEFYNLFYLLKTNSDEIPINDVCGESFLKFLEFVYTETTELNMDNIKDLMMLAVRYSVENLKDFCVAFLIKSVTDENVLSLLDTFSIYDIPNFELECFDFICLNRLVFEDPSFYEISNKTLTTILKSEELIGFKEISIFRAVDKWAEIFCDKNNKDINSNNKRIALGEALKYVRFGAMTSDEFSSCTLENSVLTSTEMVQVFQFICTNGKVNCPYSGESRMSGLNKVNIRNGPILNTPMNRMVGFDLLRFTANKNIIFHGFGIIGRVDCLDKQNPEKLIIQLKDTETRAVLMNDVVEIHHDGTRKEYELLFNKARWLKGNKSYTVHIQRQEYGVFLNYVYNVKYEERKQSINVEGVTFDLVDFGDFSIVSALVFVN